MAFLTVALIFIGAAQWRTSNTQARILSETLAANKVIERAYITMSHTPTGAFRVLHSQPGSPDSQDGRLRSY
jgi:hypothetical protein